MATGVAAQLTNVTDPSQAQDAATKNYVDTRVSAAGFLFDTPNFADQLINGNNLTSFNQISGAVASISLSTPDAATAAQAVSYFNSIVVANRYYFRFTGSTVSFQVASASIAGSVNVTVNLTATTTFTTTVLSGVNLQFWDGVPITITDLAIGSNMTSTIGIPASGTGTLLTLNSTGGTVSITSPNNTLVVGGTSAAPTLDVAIPAETIRIDAEIANKIGSATLRTQLSNGTEAVVVIINQVSGQPVTMTITTRTDSTAILATLNAAGSNATTISNAQTGGNTLLVQSWSSQIFQIVATFPAATTLAQVQALFSGARSDSVYYGGPTTGQFTFVDAPKQAIANQFVAGSNITLTQDANRNVTIASTGGGSSGNIFDVASSYNADNVGVLTRINSSTPLQSAVTGTIQNIDDFGSVNITSLPFPPPIATGYNSAFIGISASDESWGGVGRLTATGIDQIAWKRKPAAAGAFTGARLWQVVDNIASIYAGTDLNTVQSSTGPVTSVLFPELTHSYVSDELGGKADTVTTQPFIDSRIATKIGSVPSTYTNSGGLTVGSGFGNAGTTATFITTSYATAKAFLQTALIGAIAPASGLGNWTLPSWPILISNIASPTSAQFGTVTQIQESSGTQFLSMTISGNAAYFAGFTTQQPLFFFGNPAFVFQDPPKNAIQTFTVASLNGLQGFGNLTSSDNTIAIARSGQNIDLKGQATGGAGVATGYNIGDYVQANIRTYAGGSDPTVETQTNEAGVQIGSGSGYTTNSLVIKTQTGSQGWSFGGQTVTNFVAELGAQRQTFRFGISGNWNIGNLNPYGTSGTTAVLIPPLFLKEAEDYNSPGAQFPGFTPDGSTYEVFNATGPVTATARYSLDLGKTVSAVAAVSTATVASSTVFVTLVTVNNVTNITQAACSLPLEAQIGGVWTYIGTEWNISSVAGNVLQLTLTTNLATLTVGESLRIQNNATIPLIAWNSGIPPLNTSFGTAQTTATGNGYLEITVQPNTWYLDSYLFKPTGFTLPASTSRYNLTWQAFMPGVVNVNSTQYFMYNAAADSFYSPAALTQWNNRLTANFGGVSALQNLQSVTTVGNFTNLGIAFRDVAATPNSVTLSAPAAVTTSYSLKLPAAQATAAGQVLSNDGSGNLSWGASTSGLEARLDLPFSGGPNAFAAGIQLQGRNPNTTLAFCQSFFGPGQRFTINQFVGGTQPVLVVANVPITSPSANLFNITLETPAPAWFTNSSAIGIYQWSTLRSTYPIGYDVASNSLALYFDKTMTSDGFGNLAIARQGATQGQGLGYNVTNLAWEPTNFAGNWLTGSGTPADSLGQIGSYYQDTSVSFPGNYVWLKTQTATSPYWVRQPNLENAIKSYTLGTLSFSFARVVATANITLSGLQTIDGTALTAGDIVLAIAQTSSSVDNGLYVVSSGGWVRASTTIVAGLVVVISLGTINRGNSFIQTLPIVTVGVSSQSWTLFSSAGASTLQAVCAIGSTTTSSMGIGGALTVGYTALNNSNTIVLTGTASGSSPTIAALGTDTNIGLNISPKGTASTTIGNTSGASGITVAGGQTTYAELIAAGFNTNLDLYLASKGSGNVNIGGAAFTNLQVAGGSTASLTLSPIGSATNLELILRPKGTGNVTLGSPTATGFSVVGGLTAAAQLQAQGNATDIDVVLLAKGLGNYYPIGNSLGLPSTQPKAYYASAKSSQTLGIGAAGQVLTSNGATSSPYWGAPIRGAIYKLTSTYSVPNNASTISAGSFTQVVDSLGLTVGTTWTIPANSGRLKITFFVNPSAAAGVTYTAYFALSTATTIVTSVPYGTGAETSVIQYNNSGFTSSATGGTPASAVILRPYGAGDNFASTAVGYLENATSAQVLTFTAFQNSGTTITLPTSCYISIETGAF